MGFDNGGCFTGRLLEVSQFGETPAWMVSGDIATYGLSVSDVDSGCFVQKNGPKSSTILACSKCEYLYAIRSC